MVSQIGPLVDGGQAKKWRWIENLRKFTPWFVHISVTFIDRWTNYTPIDLRLSPAGNGLAANSKYVFSGKEHLYIKKSIWGYSDDSSIDSAWRDKNNWYINIWSIPGGLIRNWTRTFKIGLSMRRFSSIMFSNMCLVSMESSLWADLIILMGERDIRSPLAANSIFQLFTVQKWTWADFF